MIYAFIRSYIGGFGRALMDFYIQNSLWINGILLAYALLVVFAHRNYLVALEKIFTQVRSSNEKYFSEGIKKLTSSDYKKINWEAIRALVKFPLISEPHSWGIKWVSVESIKKEFSMDRLNGLLTSAREKKGK